MNDHLRPVGKPAPPRPRRPDAFISADDPVLAFIDQALRIVPSAARTGAFEAPIAEAVEIGEDAILVLEHRLGPYDCFGSDADGCEPPGSTPGSAEGPP